MASIIISACDVLAAKDLRVGITFIADGAAFHSLDGLLAPQKFLEQLPKKNGWKKNCHFYPSASDVLAVC